MAQATDIFLVVLDGGENVSPRKADAMLGYVQGYNIPTIAKMLFISTNTVKRHTAHIYHKTGVENRQQLWDLFTRTFRGSKRS